MQATPAVKETDGLHDFDFLHGRWQVANRRLRVRLQGSDEWEEFLATTECRPTLGGLGNLETYSTDHWPGYQGMALRFFDPEARTWSIYWADNRIPGLQPPVVGSFSNGIGHFEGPDQHEGQPVSVRFLWSILGPDAARWEQAFSTDQGGSWEVNWVMSFSRLTK